MRASCRELSSSSLLSVVDDGAFISAAFVVISSSFLADALSIQALHTECPQQDMVEKAKSLFHDERTSSQIAHLLLSMREADEPLEVVAVIGGSYLLFLAATSTPLALLLSATFGLLVGHGGGGGGMADGILGAACRLVDRLGPIHQACAYVLTKETYVRAG